MFEKISRRAICAVCMKPLGAFGTLDLRKCGHRVHAQCLVGVERDEEGHPMCEACKFIARYNSLKRTELSACSAEIITLLNCPSTCAS
eukprot:g16587.t1